MKWILIICAFTILAACIRDKVSCERDYAFEIDVILEEAKDTFSIGDTIFLSMDFSKMLTDKISGEKFDATSFSLNSKFSIAQIDTDPASCTGGLFDFVEQVGARDIVQLTSNCLSQFINYQETEEMLRFSFGFIPKEKGLFISGVISHFDFAFPELVKNCKTTSFEVNYTLNPKGGDSNFELLKYSPEDRIKNATMEYLNAYAGFAFVVVD